MSKFKYAVSIFVAVIMIGSGVAAPMTAQARTAERVPPSPQMEHDLLPQIITPFWQNVTTAQVSISASGRTLRPGLAVTAATSNQRISGTLFLERQSGNSWVRVTSWAVSGTGTLRDTRTFTGTAGGTYRARIVVTVGSDRIERISSSVRV